jgi:hypothetical protein
MRDRPKWGTAPIRCGRTRCKWRGYEGDLAPRYSGSITRTHVCPDCGCDCYMFMTEKEIAVWEKQKEITNQSK